MMTKDEIIECRHCDLPCAPNVDCPIIHTWHTGTPTENGEYLVCRVPKAGYLFRYNQLCIFSDLMGTHDHKIFYIGEVGKASFENITDSVIAWQKIEPYKEQNNG